MWIKQNKKKQKKNLKLKTKINRVKNVENIKIK